MEVGLHIDPMFGFTWDDIREMAHAAETGRFTSVWLSDHLFLGERTSVDCLDTWSTLCAIAVLTKTIRLGAMVTCQRYRSPALLAKIAATVDRISGGRLDFGVGAGWKADEHTAYGYDFALPSARVDQLVETLEICTRMWTKERATYAGRYYRVEDAPCSPKPLQRPLPIWIGGGKPRILRVAVRWAHALNLLHAGFPSARDVAPVMRELDALCRSSGRDPRALRRSTLLFVMVARTRRELDDIVGEQARSHGPVVSWRASGSGASGDLTTPKEWLAARPGVIAGTPDEVGEALKEYSSAGIDHVGVRFAHPHEREMLGLFARDVLPGLR